MVKKKYELLKTNYKDHYRIKALKDFQLITSEMVQKGDLGGYVDGENNLSQEGNCWIGYHARAIKNSRVLDDAVLKDSSEAYDNATVSGNAVLKDSSEAYDNATVSGNAVMKDCSIAYKGSIITGNALLQADQRIRYGTVTTDLLGTKDWIGALYAELGIAPKNNKVILYKKVWSTNNTNVFKSNYDENFLYKTGKISIVQNIDEDVFKSYARGLHFTSLEFINNYDGDAILKCEVEIPDIVTVQESEVRIRKCRVIGIYKGE